MHDHTESLTTHEHVRFSDGDHVIIHSSPGKVQVTGMLGGTYVEESWDARTAAEQARLLEVDAPDALWSLPADRARRIATAMDGAVGAAMLPAEDRHQETDPADSERVALDDGHADVDVIDQHVEATATLAGKVTVGLALTADEADRIGQALRAAAHRANVARAAQIDLEGVETVTDLWLRSQETGVPASALVEVIR